MKIEELGLSARPYNVLKRKGINTVEQLRQLSDDDLMLFRGMGRHSLAEIRKSVTYVKIVTNADRIRKMTDEDLVDLFYDLNMEDTYCTNRKECFEKLDTDQITDAMCKKCLLEWLKQPAEVDYGKT
jgi:hypothetical protein